MKLLNYLLGIFLSIVAASALAAEPVDPYAATVNQFMTQFIQENNIPGAAAVVYVNNKPTAYYYGYADAKKTMPVTQDTIFEIGSLTKIITSVLLAQEIDFDKMRLKDPVNKYVSYLPASLSHVTIRELATHTSGLPMNFPASVQTNEALQNYLADWKQPATETWNYSNVGIGLLGYAVENETTMDFDKLYFRHIISPLGMKKITTHVPEKYEKFYADGHAADGKVVPHSDPKLLPAAGGVKASVENMQILLGAAVGIPNTPVRVFYPMRMTQSMYVKLPDRWQGLGWELYPADSSWLSVPETPNRGPISVEEVSERPMFDGNMLMDKTGQTDGFRSYIAVVPNKQAGVVILTNKVVSNGAIVKTGRSILLKLAG